MIALAKVSETATTLTLEWTPVPGATGYRFTAEKQAKPSHSWDPGKSSIKFSKGSAWYRVEALGVQDSGQYPQFAPPPPPSGQWQMPPYVVHALGDDPDGFSDAQLGRHCLVMLSPFQYHRVAGIKAAYPNTKVLIYKTASDCRDVGIGAQIPPLATRLGWDTTLTYNECLVHDQAHSSDKWVLTTDGTTPVNPWFAYATQYGGNVSKPSYRAQSLLRLREQLQHQPLWDGFFFDNVSPSGSAFCHEIPNKAAWQAALKGWAQAVCKPLRDDGYVITWNTNVYIGGDSGSDNGALTREWWSYVGPGLVDGLMSEYAYQDPNDSAHCRLSLPGYPNEWDAWADLPSAAYGSGSHPLMNIMIHGSQGSQINSRHMRYGIASAMLKWSGEGPVFSFGIHAGAGDPNVHPLNFDLGQPAGNEIAENGGHKRKYQNGWVAVNSTTSTITVNCGGTNRSIPSGDAYIGV